MGRKVESCWSTFQEVGCSQMPDAWGRSQWRVATVLSLPPVWVAPLLVIFDHLPAAVTVGTELAPIGHGC